MAEFVEERHDVAVFHPRFFGRRLLAQEITDERSLGQSVPRDAGAYVELSGMVVFPGRGTKSK